MTNRSARTRKDIRNRRRLLVSSSALLAGLGTVSLAAQAAPAVAAPAPGATASVGPLGLTVTSNQHPNAMTLRILDNRFTVVDTAPISPGDGCRTVPAAAGQFAVSCRIVRSSTTGAVLSVRVDTGAGDDSFDNRASAPVRVQGGPGDDVLRGGAFGDLLDDSSGSNELFGRGGGDALRTEFGNDTGDDRVVGGGGDDDIQAGNGDDTLTGGAGNDTIRAGFGADTIDGGTGTDAAVYLENGRTTRVVVSIDNQSNDGGQPGGPGSTEGDNVMTTIEELFGTHAGDLLTGSDDDDRLEGNLGDDVLIGLRGADDVDGGPGSDQLASNTLFGVPVADDSIDVLDGNSDTDRCRIPFEVVEDDATVSCELIDED